MVDLDALRAAYRDACPEEGSSHLSEESWDLLSSDGLGPEDREIALGHILECPRCADTYRAVVIVRSGACAFDPDAPAMPDGAAPVLAGRKGLWRGVGLLAMAATLVLAVVLPIRWTHDPAMVESGGVVRSAEEVTAVEPVSPLGKQKWRPGEDVPLRWTVGESKAAVSIEILDVDGELVWTSPETVSPEVLWPAEEIPGFGSYYWQVLVRDRSADVVESELVSFDLVK